MLLAILTDLFTQLLAALMAAFSNGLFGPPGFGD